METYERIVVLSGLLKSTFRRWRSALLIGLVLAVLLAALQGLKLRGKYGAVGETVVTSEEESDADVLRSQMKENLLQINRVLADKSRYYENSILIKLDPSAIARANFNFTVHIPSEGEEESESVSGVALPSSGDALQVIGNTGARSEQELKILDYYMTKALYGVDFSALAEDLGTEEPYIRELITSKILDYVSCTGTVAVNYLDQDGAGRIADTIREAILSAGPDAEKLYGEHELILTDVYTDTVAARTYSSYAKDRLQEINDLMTQKTNHEKGIAALLTGGSFSLEDDGGVVVKESITWAAFFKSCAKHGIAGFIVGTVLGFIAIAVLLILSGRVLSAREFNNQFRLQKLAAVSDGRTRHGIDAAVEKIDGTYYSNPDPSKAYAIAAENIRNGVKNLTDTAEDGISVGLVGDVPADMVKNLAEKLQGEGEGTKISFVPLTDLASDPAALTKLESVSAAVVAAAPGISGYSASGDILRTVKAYHKDVLGSIVIG